MPKNWSRSEQLSRFILRHRACDCDECGPIEAPIEVELTGITILAFISQLAFCKRGALWYYILFWIVWEAGFYMGGRVKCLGRKDSIFSKNVNYKRRILVIVTSIIAWIISRELFCP
jgi:hypothetical protein